MKEEMMKIVTHPSKRHLLSSPIFSCFEVCKYLGNFSLPFHLVEQCSV